MRVFILFLLLYGDVFGTSASKSIPLLKAEMKEVDGISAMDSNTVLTSFGRLGTTKTDSFLFEETWSVVCITAPCPMAPMQIRRLELFVVSERVGECGSTEYIAVSKKGRRGHSARARMRNIDHASRICDDYKPYRWEMSLRENKTIRRFQGNPEEVNPGCQEEIPNICIMLYAPAVCVAETIDGGVTPIERIETKGGNSCQATVLLKELACSVGIAPSRFQETDIQCRVIEAPVAELVP